MYTIKQKLWYNTSVKREKNMFYALSTIIGIITGLAFGVLLTYIVVKNKFEKTTKENLEQLNLAKNELSTLHAQIKVQEDFRNLIKEDFSKLAVQTINEQQEDLRKQNREILDDKIKPLSEKLQEFQKQVNDFHKSGEVNKTEIIKEIENLRNNSQKLSEDAVKLTKALTMSQNVKGSYGEDLLDVILQSGGLRENVHYTKQYRTTAASSKDESIHKIKPDFVINLPNKKHLIIDSKLTLTSYLEYEENQNAQTKEKFKQALKARIKDLSDKNYENAADLTQLDFILLYTPIENCISMVYSDDYFQDILQTAYNSNIIIIGSASLLTVVRLVNQLWAIQKQYENSNKIAIAGANLYETFVAFCENLQDIQKKFDDVSGLFTKTINRFTRNSAKNPSLFSQVEILKKEYQINTTKQIPHTFLSDEVSSEENKLNEDFEKVPEKVEV